MEKTVSIFKKRQFFSKDFPFAILHSIDRSDHFNLSRRFRREFWKITCIVHGEGNLVVGDILYPVRPKSLIVVHPDAQTTWDIKEGSELEIFNIVFDKSVIENAFLNLHDTFNFMRIFGDDYHQEEEFPLFVLKATENVIFLIKQMYKEFESTYPNRKQMILLQLCELILLILRQINDSGHHHPEWIINFVDDNIRRHFREKISVSSLAEKIGVTPAYLSRLYHSKTGHRVVEEIKRLRLEYASELLRTSTLPISEICYISGFNDTSYFCRSFLSHFGISPLKYRNKIGQN